MNKNSKILTIDVGNTNIVFAVFENDKITSQTRVETFSNDLPKFEGIEKTIISSVVPEVDERLNKNYNNAVFIHKNLNKLPCEILIDKPEECGSDRLVNAISAYKTTAQETIILDFGTATTFDCVDNDGNYLGGVICPGIDLSIASLSRRTSKLPKIDFEKPETGIIGKSTITAMQSGFYFGYQGLVQNIVNQLMQELPNAKIIVTGGKSKLDFVKEALSEFNFTSSDNLTLDGLNYLSTFL